MCICVFVYIYIVVFAYVCMYVYVYVYALRCAFMCVRACVRVCARMSMHIAFKWIQGQGSRSWDGFPALALRESYPRMNTSHHGNRAVFLLEQGSLCSILTETSTHVLVGMQWLYCCTNAKRKVVSKHRSQTQDAVPQHPYQGQPPKQGSAGTPDKGKVSHQSTWLGDQAPLKKTTICHPLLCDGTQLNS